MIKKILHELYEAGKKGFATMGLMWTLVNITEYYFPMWPIVIKYKDNFKVLVFPAIIVGLLSLFVSRISRFRIKYKIDDIVITVKPCDIFKMKGGVSVVGINNQLHTHKGKIGENSIHNKLVNKYGEDKMIEVFKAGKDELDKGKRYFQNKILDKEFLFLPMSNVEDGAASTFGSTIEGALIDLFYNQQYLKLPNKRINIPIIGTGEAGVNLSKQNVIKLMIDIFSDFQKKSNDENISKIKTLNIIVYWKDIFEIDWLELGQWMKNRIAYCGDCKKTN